MSNGMVGDLLGQEILRYILFSIRQIRFPSRPGTISLASSMAYPAKSRV